MRTTTILAIASLSCTLLGSAHATAQTAGSQAARAAAYQKAREAMAAEDWRGADRMFSELWAKSHTYDVALGLGQVELNLEHYRDAAEHLSYGIRNLPPKEKPELEAKALDGLRFATQRVGTVRVTVDRAGASVLIDRVAVGTSPLDGEIYVDPGPHEVEAQATDRSPAKQAFQARAGETRTLDLKFTGPVLPFGAESAGGPPKITPVPGAGSGLGDAPPSMSNGSIQPRTIALWTGVGVTAVSAGLGLVFALKGSSANSDAKNAKGNLPVGACPSVENSSHCSTIDRALDDRESANKVANVSFVVAGVAAVATAAMFVIWQPRRPEAAGHVQVVPIATHDSGGLVVSGNF